MTATTQYDRGVRVTIVPPPQAVASLPLPLVINAIVPLPGVKSPPQAHIQFSASKTISPTPNPWSVRVWNLSQTTRDAISGTVRSLASWLPPGPVVLVDGVLKPGGQAVTTSLGGMASVIVQAGWAGGLEEVCQGVVTKVRSFRQGADRVTEISGTDGGFGLQCSVPWKTFAAGATSLQVLTYLSQTIQLPLAPTAGLKLLGGFVHVGPLNVTGDAVQGITDLCDPLELSWWIEDGQIWILGDGESLPGVPLVVSPQQVPGAIRLIHEPEVQEAGSLRIECALASGVTGLRVGHLIALASSEQRGTYRVESVQHQGGSRGGPFGSTAIVRDPTAALLAGL